MPGWNDSLLGFNSLRTSKFSSFLGDLLVYRVGTVLWFTFTCMHWKLIGFAFSKVKTVHSV